MVDEHTTKSSQKNWWYIISPCIIAGVLALIGIIDSYLDMEKSEGWSFPGILVAVPFFAILIVLDLIVKSIVRKKVIYVWLIELLLIGITILLLKLYYPFLW